MSPSIVSEVLAYNVEKFVPAFTAGDKPMPPGRKALILACMDARLHPESTFGLNIGDCHCVRNAGGRASDDALRSIAISQQLLGTREVIILHHTDCGMLTFDNPTIHGIIKDKLDHDASGTDFLPFSDLEKSVRDDVATVQGSKLVLPGTKVTGAIYDVKTGAVSLVE